MSDATEPSGAKVRVRDRLWAQIGGAILLVLLVFFAAFYGFALIDTHPARAWPWSAKTHPGLFELSRTAVPSPRSVSPSSRSAAAPDRRS